MRIAGNSQKLDLMKISCHTVVSFTAVIRVVTQCFSGEKHCVMTQITAAKETSKSSIHVFTSLHCSFVVSLCMLSNFNGTGAINSVNESTEACSQSCTVTCCLHQLLLLSHTHFKIDTLWVFNIFTIAIFYSLGLGKSLEEEELDEGTSYTSKQHTMQQYFLLQHPFTKALLPIFLSQLLCYHQIIAFLNYNSPPLTSPIDTRDLGKQDLGKQCHVFIV